MHIIRTTSALQALCDQPLDPTLLELLGGYAAALEEFGDTMLATIAVVQAGDALVDIEEALACRLVAGGHFTFPVELITRHSSYFDIVWIQSDDGSGLVLLIEIATTTDSELLLACENALTL